jgi:hypothetical protein
MVEPKARGRLVWLWGVVPVVALAEMFVQWEIQRREPVPEEWEQAAKAITAEKQPEDLVVIAPDWATQGRMYLKDLISLKDFGRFDTTKYERVYEVSVNGARSPESKGLSPESESHFGRVGVSRYKLPPKADVLFDFVENARLAETEGFKRMGPRIVIDHWFFPRLVIPAPLSKKGVSVNFKEVPLGGAVLVWGIVGYRSGRFDEGGPVKLSVYVDGEKIGQGKILNFSPRDPFSFPVNREGVGTVGFRIEADDGLGREFGFAADLRREPLEKR